MPGRASPLPPLPVDGADLGLTGHYALARLDGAASTLTLVTDRFATHPIFHARIKDGLVFGSSPAVVATHPLVGAALREQALYEFIYASAVPAPLTVFANVEALRSGRGIILHGGEVKEFTHWKPRFTDDGKLHSDPESERAVLQLMREAVRDASRRPDETGCFLSGGIDSSTVAGCFRDVTDQAPKTFSIGFQATGYDELEFAQTVAKHFDTVHQEYYVTPDDVLEVIPRIARAFGQPFGNASAIPAFHCARLAKASGVGTMLAGDGGDELFGGNERYGQNWIYSLFGRAPEVMQSLGSRWAAAREPIFGTLPVFRKAVSYIRHAGVPLPGRLEIFNYVNRMGAENVFCRDFLASVDVGRVSREREATFASAHSDNDINRMLALDFEITLADNDLQKVGVMCREAGIAAEYPFLADGVVDYSLGLTPRDKVNRTHLRWFFRRAVTGFLPDEVIKKSKQGFGLPFGVWSLEHRGLHDWIGDSLEDARRRGIIHPDLIRDLNSHLLQEQPRYYGPLVWLIATLETWMAVNDEAGVSGPAARNE